MNKELQSYIQNCLNFCNMYGDYSTHLIPDRNSNKPELELQTLYKLVKEFEEQFKNKLIEEGFILEQCGDALYIKPKQKEN